MTGTRQSLQFLINTGINGAHILSKDWPGARIGPPEIWPDSLKVTLGVVLNSTYPKILCWGRDLICFFNKAYADEIIGKSGDAILGNPLQEALPGLWTRISKSVNDFFENNPNIQIEVKSGYISQNDCSAELFYVFNPVFGANGNVNGLIISVRPQLSQHSTTFFRHPESHDFLFKKAVDEAHFGVVQLMGENHIIEYGNVRFFSDYLEADAGHVLGKPLFDVLSDDENHLFRKELDLAFCSGISIHKMANNSLKLKSGDFYFDYDITPSRDIADSVSGLMVTIYDVTDRVESRLKEKADHQRLQMALDAGGLALWEIDLQSMEVHSSPKLFDMFDMTGDQITTNGMSKSVHPEDFDRVIKGFRHAIETGEYFDEFRILKKNAAVGWLRARAKIFYNDEGTPYRAVGTSRDITREKKREQELRRKESRLRHLILAAPVAIGILRGPDYKVEIMNDVAARLLGKSKEMLEDKPILEVMTELDTALAKSLLDRAFYNDERVSGAEYPVKLMRNGRLEKIYVHFEYDPLKNLEGKTIGVIVVGIEVTNQVLVRKRIEKSEAAFRLLANSSPSFVWTMDADMQLRFINETFQEYVGLDLDEMNKSGFRQVVHPDDFELAVLRWTGAVKAGTQYNSEHRIRRKDGVYRWFLTRAIHDNADSTNPGRWIFTGTDINDIKEQEMQKDYFISRASHELKTPLTSLKGYVQILQSVHSGSSDDLLIHSLSKMDQQVNKLVSLINDLLDSTRISKGGLQVNKKNFLLADMLTDIAEDVQSSSNCEIILSAEDFNITVYGDKEKLGQVVTNLLTNAIKYSPDCAQVWIKGVRDNGSITVCIIDRGIGIDFQAQAKIFEKFYRVTGKNEETFPGLGIGLYIANEILKLHNSHIEVNSTPGEGSTFSFTLNTE